MLSFLLILLSSVVVEAAFVRNELNNEKCAAEGAPCFWKGRTVTGGLIGGLVSGAWRGGNTHNCCAGFTCSNFLPLNSWVLLGNEQKDGECMPDAEYAEVEEPRLRQERRELFAARDDRNAARRQKRAEQYKEALPKEAAALKKLEEKLKDIAKAEGDEFFMKQWVHDKKMDIEKMKAFIASSARADRHAEELAAGKLSAGQCDVPRCEDRKDFPLRNVRHKTITVRKWTLLDVEIPANPADDLDDNIPRFASKRKKEDYITDIMVCEEFYTKGSAEYSCMYKAPKTLGMFKKSNPFLPAWGNTKCSCQKIQK